MENSDKILGLAIQLPHGGEQIQGIVKRRKRNAEGMLIGTADDDPVLDTREYEVEFPDGSYAAYSTNTLLENLYSQIDEDGNTQVLFKGISNHRILDDALTKANGWTQMANGVKKRKVTTKG